MSEPQELATLRDIHLPEPISWWPIAPGWYLLILVLIAVIAILVYFVRCSYRNGQAKRKALELLHRYEQDYQREANSQLTSLRVSELLRRVALVYFPREEVAGLRGEAWLAFLTRTSKKIDFKALDDYLLVLPYQPAEAIDLKPLFSKVKQWIKQRGKPCSN